MNLYKNKSKKVDKMAAKMLCWLIFEIQFLDSLLES